MRIKGDGIGERSRSRKGSRSGSRRLNIRHKYSLKALIEVF